MMHSVSTACIAHATLNASSVSAHDQSCPDSPPPTFKRIFHIYEIIKQSGGREPGDEANSSVCHRLHSCVMSGI